MGFGEREQGHLFQGNKGQIFRGTGEQKQYWGTWNIRKQIFNFWGTWEQANLFQGNRYPPWEGLKMHDGAQWLSGTVVGLTEGLRV